MKPRDELHERCARYALDLWAGDPDRFSPEDVHSVIECLRSPLRRTGTADAVLFFVACIVLVVIATVGVMQRIGC